MKLKIETFELRNKFKCPDCRGRGIIAFSYRGDELRCMYCQGTGFRNRPRIRKRVG